jgi:hypothetical protein
MMLISLIVVVAPEACGYLAVFAISIAVAGLACLVVVMMGAVIFG